MGPKDVEHFELLDSTGIDFTEDQVSDDDLDSTVLSPEGDPEKLAEYERLFAVEPPKPS